MTRKISFGKVDYYNIKKNNCEVVLEFGFREFPRQEPYFSVCGEVWNNLHTDTVRGGQCVDDLPKMFPRLARDIRYKELLDLWKKYHLKGRCNIPEEDVKRIDWLIKNGF